MNPYKKWGIRYVNSFFRHMLTVTSLWGLYEVKYHEVSWSDLGWAVLVGAVIPTIKEFFTEGIPMPEDEPAVTPTVTPQPK